jgi:hypothetical protein
VTLNASDVRVSAVEGEGRIPLMIEPHRRPEGVEPMTGATIAAIRSMNKLVAVRVPVAVRAVGTSLGETENADRRGRSEQAPERRRGSPRGLRRQLLVAVLAWNGAVRPLELEGESLVSFDSDAGGRERHRVVAAGAG